MARTCKYRYHSHLRALVTDPRIARLSKLLTKGLVIGVAASNLLLNMSPFPICKTRSGLSDARVFSRFSKMHPEQPKPPRIWRGVGASLEELQVPGKELGADGSYCCYFESISSSS